MTRAVPARNGDTAPRVAGRYRAGELLGAGGEAQVHRALDLFSGEEVALKRGDASRLAAEYARAVALRHPNLARPVGFSLLPGGKACFAMEYAGQDLAAAAREGGPAELLQRVAEIARALASLHRRGVVHADVKPDNARVVWSAAGPRAVLIDLGLAADLSAKGAAGARGTPAYAAPEVLEGRSPDARSDLYSLGVLLYEALSGRNPFTAPAVEEIVRRQLAGAPRLEAPGVGGALADVAAKLLAREPGARYRDADEVIEALAASAGLALETEGEGLGPDRLSAGALAGRAAEVEALAAGARGALAGRGSARVVCGPGGCGKSRLLREIAPRLELAGLRLLAASGDGQGHGPFGEVWRQAGILLGAPGAEDPFPAGEPVLVAAEMEARLTRAAAEGPLAIVLDGLGGRGGAGEAIFFALARGIEGKPLLLIAAAERAPEGVPEGVADRLDLPPLDRDAVRAKLAEVFAGAPWAERLADVIHSGTGGNARAVEEAVRDLLARRVLRRERGRWALDEARAGADFSGASPRDPGRATRDRIAARPDEERRALAIGAVLGLRFEPGALAALGGAGAVVAAGRAARDGLLESDGAQLRFPHAALRAAALRALPPAQRRELHARASALAPDPGRRAEHLFRARARGALRASLAAARSALREGAPADASRFYQRAAALASEAFVDRRAALLVERAGDALAVAGQLREARRRFHAALRRGGEPARLELKLARALGREGRFDAALDAIGRARAAGAQTIEVDQLEAQFEAMRGRYPRAEELARGALERARALGDARAAVRLHHLLGTCAWHRGDGRGAALHERTSARLARRLRETAAEADARLGLAAAYRLLGRYDASAREAERAIAAHRESGHLAHEAKGWNNLGVARYLAGDWDAALHAWERFREIAARLGARDEEVNGLNNLGVLYKDRGDFARAREALQRALTLAAGGGGYARLEAMLLGNLGEVAALQGELGEAERLLRRSLERAREIGARGEAVEASRRLAELDLRKGRPAPAAAAAREALAEAQAGKNAVEQVNLRRVLALAARSRGDLAAAETEIAAGRAALAGVSAALESARLDAAACAVAIDRGDAAGAEPTLDRARSVFTRLGAAADLREVELLERGLEALRRKSLAHLDTLVAAVQGLSRLTDFEALLGDMIDQALRLTGAERGFVLLVGEDGKSRVAAVRGVEPGGTLRISRSVADRVFQTGEALAIADLATAAELSTQRSILDMGLRSVLCAPIGHSGRKLGLLYVDSRRAGAFLSERDLALLKAFAALAAVALEQARLYGDLERKAVLLSTLAHEFRTPLTSILAYAELSADDASVTGQVRDNMGVVVRQAERLARLINHTLELSRLEAGAVRLARERIELHEIVEMAVSGVRPLAERKGIRVQIESESKSVVMGDRDRLVQVVTNLVSNAVKFSPDGTTVYVWVGPGAPPPGASRAGVEVDGGGALDWVARPARKAVHIAVRDEGPGMPPEDVKKLFGRFYRARGGAGEGTGLGLSIAREIARQHGGDIRVESVPGRGSTFTVVLPLPEPEPEDAP